MITGSHDKGIKVFQLPLYWPSELVRKYKSKNNKKLLLAKSSNAENQEKDETEDFEKALEKLENEETAIKNKSPFGKEEENEKIEINNNNEKTNKANGEKESQDHKEENKGESNMDTTEDDDFLILKSVAKLKQGLSDRERNCEDLHGWDEDF